MEKCLCPIFDNQIEFLETTLNRHLPFVDSDTPLELPSATQEDQTVQKLTRNDVRDMGHHLLLAVMRYYREEGCMEKWNSTCDKIHDRVTTMSPEHKARFYLRTCTFFTVRIESAETQGEDRRMADR